MEISLTEQESHDLARAVGTARQVRQWRRYRAIQLLAEGQSPQQVATVLSCSLASVYNWAAAWQQQGSVGLAEARHAGRTRTLDGEALRLLEQWLETDPQTQGEQTTGWTVALLHTRLTQAGYPISQRTLRRALHRLGWRWKRPKYVLGRPDPAYDEKKGRWSRGSSRR
ncbi:MAG TPA: helix-turn-helix domain-containing protein [Ktedonobacterales bacterium]|nr:helix-turn-helix domain-containing protein [Ktedonobacterales bacterium]